MRRVSLLRLAYTMACTIALWSPAHAADPPAQPDAAALEEAKRHFADGQKLFEKGELKPAVEELKEAYRLTRNPLLLYNIAFIYDKLDDAALALHYFSKFIDEAADTERSHGQLTEASARAAALRAKLNIEEPATRPSEPATQPIAPPGTTELEHEPIDEAPPGQPIDVTVRIPKAAAWSVTLHYRAPGQDLFQTAKMRPRPGGEPNELVARIPAAAARGGAVQYYVAARDPDGKLAGFSGKSQTPNLVYLDPKAPPHHYLDSDQPVETLPAFPDKAAPRAPHRPTRPLTYAKWIGAGAAVALLGTGVGATLAARSYSDTLEAEASASHNLCNQDPPPCRLYSQQRKDIEAKGHTFERWANLTLIAGGAAAIAAGVFWYLDAKQEVVIVPVVGPGTAGAAAEVRF